MMQKEENKAKKLATKSVRYHALRNKVEFVKLI